MLSGNEVGHDQASLSSRILGPISHDSVLGGGGPLMGSAAGRDQHLVTTLVVLTFELRPFSKSASGCFSL